GGGWLGSDGKVDPKDPRASVKTKLLETLDQTALKYGVSRTIISLAWLLKHPGKIVPIVGSINPERIREAVKADAIDLSREDWYRIYTAARGKPLP
ncbi:MAG: aldo/keto reductase, partial [Phycisphaerales bacterium]|nr:aldo/keto reductase [Phycisphaerales bacterium]